MDRERRAGIERQQEKTGGRATPPVQRAEAPGQVAAAAMAAVPSPGDILALQRAIGNAAVNQLLRRHTPHTPVAPVQRAAMPASALPTVQREAVDEEEEVQTMRASAMPAVQREAVDEDEEAIQMMPAAQQLHAASTPVAGDREDLGARIRAAAGRGSALDGGVQRTLEGGLGTGLSGVRVHTGGEADTLARSVQAVAFTTGPDIFFRSGAYNPSTPAGLHLLAHEAAHTVQQAQGPVSGTPHPGGVSISDPGDSFERAAEASAARITVGMGADAAVPAQRTAAASSVPTMDGAAGTRARATGARGGFVPIQRDKTVKHQSNLWQHLKSSVAIDLTQADHKVAAVLAWVLDQNRYEVVELLNGTQAIDDDQQKRLDQIGITLAEVRAVHKANPWIVEPSATAQNLSKFIASKSPGKRTSLIEWGPVTPWGASTWMNVIMYPAGMPKGSGAGGDPAWMLQLEQHISPGQGTIYVRGHLLNDNIGGPGLDYNMVPLTGKPAKNVGANDANAEHLNKIETKVKGLWDEVRLGNIPHLQYSVVAQYNRAPRPATAEVARNAAALKQLYDQYTAAAANAVVGWTPQQVDAAFQGAALHTSFPAATPQDKATMVGRLQAHQFATATFGHLRATVAPFAADLHNNKIDPRVLNASVPDGQADNYPIRTLVSYVADNAWVWQLEDQRVPTELQAEAKWEKNAAPQTTGPVIIPVTLPTDGGAVWFRPFKKGQE